MKNLLLASTALALSAGVAAADITFSGEARFGGLYDSTDTTDDFNVHTRFRLNIDATTETDSGLEFFARIRIQSETDDKSGTHSNGISAPRVGMRYNGVEVAVGNILGAIEEMPGLYDGEVGLTALGDMSVVAMTSVNDFDWDDFSSTGGGSNGAEVIYSNGAFRGHLSHSETSGRTALNVAYTTDTWFVAAGYQDGGLTSEDKTLVTGGFTFADNYKIGIGYGDNDGVDKWRLSGDARVGSGTVVTAFVAEEDIASSKTMWGLGFVHDLGGAELVGGVVGDEDGENQADLGVRFSF
ncbi:porin [Shimia sp. Alg240-R146]|uniref:porin n=1 Tax=Shimia sp. Alg240-R146 TaxID=2993449 RepID=UPI0022E1D944|nr:porin [Shimia sp. Alg240-R146]